MNTYIFTFRNYHNHENINMQNFFIKVVAESEQVAKDVIDVYRGGYAECYPELNFKPLPKQRLFETIKQRKTNG